MTTLLIIAQAAPDVGSGAIAGWSSFGLAGLVLAWLFLVHLPGKDKRDKEKDEQFLQLLATKDAQITQTIARHDARLDQMSRSFTEALDKVVEHCKDEMRIATGRK